MKLVFKAIICIFFLCYRIIFAQQFVEISGSLPELLTAEKPYMVVGDIFVPPGSSVTIEAGAVLMFESFKSFNIQGTIFIKGEPEKPVIFTSKNDKQLNPNATVDAAPFDWNGIDIYETGVGSIFNHCIIKFSVYGIRSQTEHFKIVNSIFSNNGKVDITVIDKRQDVTPNTPFSYGSAPVVNQTPPPQPQNLALPSETEKKAKPAPDIAKQTEPKTKNRAGIQIFRYTNLAISLGSGAAAGWYYLKRYKSAQQKLEDLSVLDREEKLYKSSKDWEDAKKDRDRKIGLCIAGAGGAVLCVGLFSISFAF
jgi:hypothetical protein